MSALTVALPLGAFIGAWWLTGRVRRYAWDHHLVDTPNERSSHAVATPRGGGLAIVAPTLIAFAVLGWTGVIAWPALGALLAGGAVVSATGLADDYRHVAPHWRLLGHVTAALVVLWGMGGLPGISVVGADLELGAAGHALALIYLVWLINLTNFMDGIDGIAAVETTTACLGSAILYTVVRSPVPWLIPVILASATLGFLAWNWPPARIFMGDSGSGFLGLMLGALALQASWAARELFWSWAILLGVFLVDATVTLLRRVARGERFYQAHRTHAYQHAARRWSHRPVTLAVGVINVGWLFPWALLVGLRVVDGFVGLVFALAPLVAMAIVFKAGLPGEAAAPGNAGRSQPAHAGLSPPSHVRVSPHREDI